MTNKPFGFIIFVWLERGRKLKSIKRSINIPDDLYEKLQETAKEKGITVAALIKLACSEYIKKEKKNG